jgi:hypothetical protein
MIVRNKEEVKPLRIQGFPTVLIAEDDEGLDSILGHRMREQGYNVIEAHGWANVLHFVTTHSRPIHLLLANRRMAGDVRTLEVLRSELYVLFVKKFFDADELLAKIRQLLGSSSAAPIR